MNKKWVIASSILALALVHASGQASGGGGGGGAGSGASGGTGASVGAGTTGGATVSGSTTTSSGTSGQSSTTVNSQRGVQNPRQVPPNRNQLPPGVQYREPFPPGSQVQGQVPPQNVGTNAFTQGSTNQGSFTNGFAGGTNGFGNTNLTPTGMDGTNRVYWTNRFDSRHFDRDSFRDEAITPGDQSLLIRIRQTIITEISVSTSGGANWVPMHFSIHSGHVRMTGLVRSADEAQRLQAMLSQMPGVSGVDNGLSTLPPDQATTESDRAVLTQIRQVIPPQPAPGPWTPISFNVQQGAVGIVGIVPTTQESQRIETTVRQVPGVVRTSNTLIVDASTGANMTPTSR